MSISATSGNFAFAATFGTATHQITLPSARPSANSSIVLGFLDRSGGAVITDVLDSVNGSWGSHSSTHTDGSLNLTRVYIFPASASGTPTVTVTTEVSQNAQLTVGWVQGTVVAPTFEAAATVANDTSSNTDTDSNTVTAAGGGGIMGFLYTPNAQSTTPTADGAGESLLISGGAGIRTFMCFEAYASGGAHGFELTLASASTTVFHVVALQEAAGNGAAPLTNAIALKSKLRGLVT